MKVLVLGVHERGDLVSVAVLAERDDVQLVDFRHLLDEMLAPGPKLGVIGHTTRSQLVMKYLLLKMVQIVHKCP